MDHLLLPILFYSSDYTAACVFGIIPLRGQNPLAGLWVLAVSCVRFILLVLVTLGRWWHLPC